MSAHDPRPLQAIRDHADVCFDCYSSLSAVIAVLDERGQVVYGNAAFAEEVPAWSGGVDGPQPLARLWPQVMAELPALQTLREETDHTTHVREVQLCPGEADPRDHLIFLDPVRGRGCGDHGGWILSLIDISHIRRAERSNRDSLAIEMFLSRLSARFVGTTEIRAAIETSLAEIGRLADAGRVFFASWSSESSGIAEFIAWQREDVADPRTKLGLSGDLLRPWYESLFAVPEIVELDDLKNQLPPDIQQLLTESGDDLAGSLLMVPLVINDGLAGVVGIRYHERGATAASNAWIALDIFCHVLERVIQLKRSEEALVATNQELQAKSAQLVQSEKMASIGQMAAGVAHEINNPVGFIMSNLSTLQEYAPQLKAAIAICRTLADTDAASPESIRDALGELDHDDLAFMADDLDDLLGESLEGCERVREIVQNLKGFARGDENVAQPVDLNECVESTLKIVWNELKYRCDIVKDYGELPPVVCFPGKINQVVMNLLVNAAHAIAERGTITIRTSIAGDRALIAVTDDGSGIAPDTISRLFDPFYTTKAPGQGTGLGLYICHNIIEEHGGEIDVESTLGIGTTFTVRLPLQPAAQPEEESHVLA